MQNTLRETVQKNEKLIGTTASVLAVIMFFSLIEILVSNLKGTSNIFIQPLATSVSGLFWSLYGYSKMDWFILVPNLLALILGLVTAISAFV